MNKSKQFNEAMKKLDKLTESEIFNAFYKAFLKPLPLYRILFCSKKSNIKWYDKRIKKYLSIIN